MSTPTKSVAVQRGPYRIAWHGGEYADVTARGIGVIDTLNMTRPDGTIPDMSRDTLRAAIAPEDVASWRETVREMRRFPIGGIR